MTFRRAMSPRWLYVLQLVRLSAFCCLACFMLVACASKKAREADHIRLQPENSTMDPIITTDCSIAGKVVAVFRRL